MAAALKKDRNEARERTAVPSFVNPLHIELDRREQDGAYDERNQQPFHTLDDVLAC